MRCWNDYNYCNRMSWKSYWSFFCGVTDRKKTSTTRPIVLRMSRKLSCFCLKLPVASDIHFYDNPHSTINKDIDGGSTIVSSFWESTKRSDDHVNNGSLLSSILKDCRLSFHFPSWEKIKRWPAWFQLACFFLNSTDGSPCVKLTSFSCFERNNWWRMYITSQSVRKTKELPIFFLDGKTWN